VRHCRQQATDLAPREDIGDKGLWVPGLLLGKGETIDVAVSNEEAIETRKSPKLMLPGDGRVARAVEERLDLTGRNPGRGNVRAERAAETCQTLRVGLETHAQGLLLTDVFVDEWE